MWSAMLLGLRGQLVMMWVVGCGRFGRKGWRGYPYRPFDMAYTEEEASMSKRPSLSVRHRNEVPGTATSDPRAGGRPRSATMIRRAIERANASWECTMYDSMRFAHDERPFWWSRAVVETPPLPSSSVACVPKVRRLYTVSSPSSARSIRALRHKSAPSRHVCRRRLRQCRGRARNSPVPCNLLFDKVNPARDL